MKRILVLSCWMSAVLTAGAQPASFSRPSDSAWRIEKINPDYDWTRHFRVGALLGLNISADFKMDGQFGISGNNPSAGIYDDGYVRPDNTGNAGGYTSFWGYDNAKQLQGTTLTLHSASAFSANGSTSSSDDPYLGFDLAYGDTYWYWGRAKIGWEFGFGLLPIHIANHQPMAASVTQSSYQFEVGNPYGAPIPGAGYQGGPSGTGYIIPFTDHPTPAGSTTIPGTVTGTRTMDVTLYTFRLGPSLYWDLGRRFGLYASAGPALGLVSGELKYNETIHLTDGSSAPNAGHIGATDMVFGGYVNATLVYHADQRGDFYIGAQYMPMGSAGISGAGREGNLNLGGQVYFTAGINWPF